jgi:site-specific DNA-adenine methylase
MTSYHGGKQFLGKRLAQVIYDVSAEIEDEEDFEIEGYCEPFCGMLGVYQHIPEFFEDHRPKLKYKAGDTNKSVIMMWQEAQKGWVPPTKCSEKYYQELRYNNKDSAEKGFIGHQCSFGGIYLHGYALKYGKSASSVREGSKNVVQVAEKMKQTKFSYGDYTQFSHLKGYIIYCDPPYSKSYQGYKKGKRLSKFNSEEFWDWCEKMSRYNIVFVSEYSIPKNIDADLVFEKTSKLTGGHSIKSKARTERLYVI